MPGKFDNKHDEYIWSGSFESGVVRAEGSEDGPVGSFAAVTLEEKPTSPDEAAALEHYGSRWLILFESQQGFVHVLSFETEVERDIRITELQQAHGMWEVGLLDGDAIQAVQSYRAAAVWSSVAQQDVMPGLSVDAQRRTKVDVVQFLIENREDLPIYMRITGRDFSQVGADFWLARNGKPGFRDFAAGPVVDALVASAVAFGPQGLTLTESGEFEVA